MMTDLISRSAVLDVINEERRFVEDLRKTTVDSEDMAHNTGQLACVLGLAIKIKKLPAIDAVPVVRCRECCYHAKDGESLYCTYHDNINVTEEFYCATGEVKDAQANRLDGQHARQGTDGD